MNSICKVCGTVDSYVCNGDASGCEECLSIEQGFLFVDCFSDELSIDEDGFIYKKDEELDGPIACEWLLE